MEVPAADAIVRLSVDRDAQRLRELRARGDGPFKTWQLLLGLMRSLKAFPLSPGGGHPLHIPLVFAGVFAESPDQSPMDLPSEMHSNFADDIDRMLCRDLRDYYATHSFPFIFRYEIDRRGMVLDQWTPHAFNPGSHPLFRAERRLPALVRRTCALVKLAFPVEKELVSVVFAVAFDGKPLLEPLRRYLPGTCRLLARRLQRAMTAEHEANARASTTSRDVLNNMHRQIASLASRYGLSGWDIGMRGNNFVVALQEQQTRTNRWCMRYRLTDLNVKALESSVSWPSGMAAEFHRRRKQLRDALDRLAGGDDHAAEAYVGACGRAVRDFDKMRLVSVNAVKERLESQVFPLELTPGSSIFREGSPEIVRGWLTDPRARGNFVLDYPSDLMAWEHLALPETIYYAPIADGHVRLGLCGVDAELVTCGAGPELQDIIDTAAPVLRARLLDEGHQALSQHCREARDAGVGGTELWRGTVERLRHLAFYGLRRGLSEVDDTFQSKLVPQSALRDLGVQWEVPEHAAMMRDVSLKALKDRQLRTIREIKPELPEDFLAAHLDRKAIVTPNEGALLCLTLLGAPEHALLVLVPKDQDVFDAKEFFSRAIGICNDTYGEPDVRARMSTLVHTFEHVLPFLQETFTRRDEKSGEHGRLMVEVLNANVRFVRGERPEDRAEAGTDFPPLGGRELLAVLRELHATLAWCVASKPLDGVSVADVTILGDALKAVSMDGGFSFGRVRREDMRLFLWELCLNVCLHAESRASFALRVTSAGPMLIVRNDRQRNDLIDRNGHHGLVSLQRVAGFAGLVHTGRIDDATDEYVSEIRPLQGWS